MPEWINNQAIVTRALALWQRLPVDYLRTIVVALLAMWILSMLADIFWRVMPTPTEILPPSFLASTPASSQQQTTNDKKIIDVSTMQSWHLFGVGQAVTVTDEAIDIPPVNNDSAIDAKETRLQLKLLGLMQSSNADSYAIIESGGTADLYRIGQSLPAGQNIKLSRVLADRVIIDNKGSLESLLLYDENERKSQSERATLVQQSPQVVTVDQRSNRRLTEIASGYRRQLMSNPMSLSDVIRVSLERDSNGNTVGYSIRPGRDRQQFAEFGLQSGDIVTAVNGILLNDPQQAMEVYNQLRTAQQASLSVKRGTEEMVILVNLSE